MANRMEMDEKSRLRQYWLRVLLAIGLLWGTMPPITIALVILGWQGSGLVLFAVVFNAFTVLPACVLAFWHRRAACIWLSVDGVLAVMALYASLGHPQMLDMPEVAALAGPPIVAGILDFMEIKRWPGALDR